ncbi:MAG: isoprenylcysteine carboxylmethyltransferase family protein [Proteobacteria bacterium]|nr:isoprenylcysteine carboxylmethyltransferase family protein [Pseudomonadota bacterium]
MGTVDPSPFTLPWAVLFWAVYIWAFYVAEAAVVRHSKATRAAAPVPTQDGLKWIALASTAAAVAALGLAYAGVGVPAQPAATVLFGLGLALMLAGSALRRHCFRMLGAAFTYEVRVAPGQHVVDLGAYRWVRHPAYLAGLVMTLGFGLATTSLAAATLVLGVTLIVYLRRIRAEEAALLATLGDDYRRYAAGRKRLLPFIY